MKPQGHLYGVNEMVAKFAKAAALSLALLTSWGALPTSEARAEQMKTVHLGPGQSLASRNITLGVNQSMVLETTDPVRDLLVSNPAVADAVLRTANRVYIIAGSEPGATNIFIFGEGGRQIAGIELAVEVETRHMEEAISNMMPNSSIRATSVNGSIVLSGTAATPAESSRAHKIAVQMVGDAERVVNMISIESNDQVHLRVTIAEMDREVSRGLGIDLGVSGSLGATSLTSASSSPGLSQLFGSLSGQGSFGSDGSYSFDVDAFEQRGVLKTLAEPTLTAISGESANFLVGGEVPIPTSVEDGTVSVEYKKFGVSLSFRPVVLDPGRISVQVEAEVSEVDTTVSISLGNGLSLPGFKVRRAQTTVELPSGGAMVLGGLLRENITTQIGGLPGLMDLPILGTLFRSRDYIREQTELVVIVTPYLVDPISTADIKRPGQNFQTATDAQGIFLNKINRQYQVPGRPLKGANHGSIGFIFE